MSSTMSKKSSPRKGTAFWFPDDDADLLRAVAAAEDRTIQAVLRRALQAYAAASHEYSAGKRPAAKRKERQNEQT